MRSKPRSRFPQRVSASSRLVARAAARPVADVLAEAVHAAEGCDVAVVVVGLTEEQETEAADKTTIALPGEQDALVSSVAAHARAPSSWSTRPPPC